MALNRRHFLSGAAALLALPSVTFAQAAGERRFVFIIQRGAADGLHTLIPHADPHYASLRGALAIEPDAALKLDGSFALHPALGGIADLYRDGQAIMFHAVASPYRERSHFDGQNVLETGGAQPYVVRDGSLRLAITQADIRAIQLAKAALYAGVRLLMDHYPVDRVDRIVLTGAFGSHIDVKYAMVLGLIPDSPLAHVRSAGNAAGTGARIALLNVASRREIAEVARRIVKIETALEPRFQEHFVAAMALPHRTDPFPNLAEVVTLPARTATAAPERRRRRGG